MKLCFYCEEQKATTIKLGEAACEDCKNYVVSSTAPTYKMTERDKAEYTRQVMKMLKYLKAKKEED